MTNQYYASPVDLAPGTKARAGDINTIDQSVDAAFDKLPAELVLKSGTVNYAVNKSATANAYAVDLAAAITAYADGLEVKLKPGSDNTGACTLNVNGLGAIAIKRQDGTDAAAGDLVGASPITLVYSGASNTFRLPPLANAQVTQAAASAQASANSATASANSAGAASGYATAAIQARNDAQTAATNAGNSATAASTSAGNASTSAGQAAGSAQSAATSASNLAAAVTAASGSATAASNSATAASTSAGNAATSATNSANSATASANSATASATSATNAATSATNANNSAQSAASSAQAATNTANQLAASVAASASSASSSAQQAGVARDAAIAAWQASTAPTEQLAAISNSLMYKGAVVDAFIYDTSRDSDGGAWRKRCKHTSWENETLVTGKWLGVQANLAAAQAAGGVNGDYYQSAVDSRFYGVGTGEQFRGNTREFPAVALIVVQAVRVVIYDATKPDLPMWMVFAGGSTAEFTSSALPANGNLAVHALNGRMYVANADTPGGTWLSGLWQVSFIADESARYTEYAAFKKPSGLALRNTIEPHIQSAAPIIANRKVSDVSAVVLPDAPIDLATGLPIPTVAVATNNGVSILKQDGTVINWLTGFGYMIGVYIDVTGQLVAIGGATVAYKNFFLNSIPTTTPYQTADTVYAAGNIPARPGTDGNTGNMACMAVAKSYVAFGSSNLTPGIPGLQLYKRIPSVPLKSMVNFITNAYASGWQVGDIRGAWLADTVTETVTDTPELITNGTFATNITGWTAASGAQLAWSNGAIRVTTPGGVFPFASQAIVTVPGKTYRLTATCSAGTVANGLATICAGPSGPGDNSLGYLGLNIGQTGTLTFTATTGTTYIGLYLHSSTTNGQYAEFDNVKCRPVLVNNGTFTVDTTGWVNGSGSVLSVVNGALRIQNPADNTTYGAASQAAGIAVTPGRRYRVTYTNPAGTGTLIAKVGSGQYTNDISGDYIGGFMEFTAPAGGVVYLSFVTSPNVVGAYADVDNITVVQIENDRSVKSKGLSINGAITKAPVAAGAQLVGYSGFSAANYLEQPYNTDLDYGTGDFSYIGWVYITDIAGYTGLLHRTPAGQGGGLYVQLAGGSGAVIVYSSLNSSYSSILSTGSTKVPLNTPTLVEVSRTSGILKIKLNGVTVASVSSGENLTYANAVLRLGCQSSGNEPVKGWMALWRSSATAPTDDQSMQIYRDELALFQANAQCTVYGTNAQIASMAYDDITDVLHVVTPAGNRSAFKGLVRVDSETTAAGVIGAAVAAAGGTVINGGASGASYSAPAIGVREELRRRYEVRQAMAREEIPIDFDGQAAQTAFTLPLGFTTKGVFVAGTKKRAGTTKDYTTSYDGYRETVNFAVSPGATWVQITANRSI